jgi:hypothetical protein
MNLSGCESGRRKVMDSFKPGQNGSTSVGRSVSVRVSVRQRASVSLGLHVSRLSEIQLFIHGILIGFHYSYIQASNFSLYRNSLYRDSRLYISKLYICILHIELLATGIPGYTYRNSVYAYCILHIELLTRYRTSCYIELLTRHTQ